MENTQSRVPMTSYPKPGKYVAWVRRCKGALAEGRRVRRSWCGPEMDAEAFRRDFCLALDRRINDRGGIIEVGRKFGEMYQTEMRRDCYNIRARVTSRRRLYQIITPELRRRFAHIIDSRED